LRITLACFPQYNPACGQGIPFPVFSSLVYSLPHLLLFFTFSLFPFLVRFTYSLLSSIPSVSTRIVTTLFPGRRLLEVIKPGFSLVLFILCYLYCLVKIYSGVLFIWFSLVLWFDSFLSLL